MRYKVDYLTLGFRDGFFARFWAVFDCFRPLKLYMLVIQHVLLIP